MENKMSLTTGVCSNMFVPQKPNVDCKISGAVDFILCDSMYMKYS